MPNVIEIGDFAAPELDVYARLTEGQLKNRADLARGLFIAESPNVILRALDAGYEPVSLLMERKHIEGQAAHIVARCGEIPLYTAELSVLKELWHYFARFFDLPEADLHSLLRLTDYQDFCRRAGEISTKSCIFAALK